MNPEDRDEDPAAPLSSRIGTSGQAFYDQLWKREESEVNRHERDRYAVLLRLAESLSSPGVQILDAGCGTGKLARRLASCGTVTGIDWSAGGLEVARSRVTGVEFSQFDLVHDDISPLAGRFGLAVCSEVIEHVGQENRRGVVRKLEASLCDGGFLLLTTPNRRRAESLAHLGARWQPEEDLLNPEETLELLRANGLAIRWTGSATFLEGLWESSSVFRRLRSALPRSRFGDDAVDRLLGRTRLGLYFVVCAARQV